MKRCLQTLIIISVLGVGNISFSQSQFAPMISKMENAILGMTYDNQTDSLRLARLEERIYGNSSSAAVSTRVKRLSEDLSADVIGQEIKPKKDTFASEEDSIKEEIPKADSSVNYASVNRLEDKVFKKEFKNLDVKQRLSNLEKQVFKKDYTDDLNSRVSRLESAVLPQRIVQSDPDGDDVISTMDNSADPSSLYSFNNSNNMDDGFSTGGAGSLNQYNNKNSVLDKFSGKTSIDVKLASIEKSVLKQTYPNDGMYNRITRLEETLFNTNFDSDDVQTRMERISSAYKAQKTSKKYDGNRFSQHAATAVQVGALILMVLAFIL